MLSHHEEICQICSVSFNIGRVRTVHEPLEAGWDPTGSHYHLRDATSSLCSRYSSESGCQNIALASPPNAHVESRYQHLAGPGCTFQGGYNGNRIAELEMKGVNRARYILGKRRGGEVDDSGPEFLVSAETVVTLADRGNGKLREELHDVSEFVGQKYPTSEYCGEVDVAIPVHDACWKIFERVSTKRLGRVDLDGFVALWWREACEGCEITGLKQDPVIRDLKEKWWVHRPGTEYLAANPVDIHGFKLSMRGAYAETPKGEGAFSIKEFSGQSSKRSTAIWRGQNERDSYNQFPTEWKNKDLSILSPDEIPSLRSSSRSSHQLPNQIFRQFIEEELPWFWEIDEVRVEVESQYQDDFLEQYGNDLDLLEGIITPSWFAFIKERMEKTPMYINWYQVYKQLKIMEKGSLGLRNRLRIWNVAEEVVVKIDGMNKGLDTTGGQLAIYPKEMAGKNRNGKDHSYCPGCSNVQVEMENEDIFEESSVDDNSRGSSEGYVSEEVSSSEEDLE